MDEKLKKALLAGIKKWSSCMYPGKLTIVTKSYIATCDICDIYQIPETLICDNCPLCIKWGHDCAGGLWYEYYNNFCSVASDENMERMKKGAKQIRKDLIEILKENKGK